MDTMPLNGESITVGGKTYTFQTVLTDVDGNVLIGASLATAQAKLAAVEAQAELAAKDLALREVAEALRRISDGGTAEDVGSLRVLTDEPGVEAAADLSPVSPAQQLGVKPVVQAVRRTDHRRQEDDLGHPGARPHLQHGQ